MANEITTTAYDDVTHPSLVEPVMIAALAEQPGLWALSREFNLIGKPTAAAKIPKEVSWWGSADDDGAGVDAELNGTEGTDVSNTASTTSSVTLTAGEYAVAMEVTDNVEEDSISGLDLFTNIRNRMVFAISLAMEDDFLALLASLSNSVGSTGVDLSIANMLSAQTGPRRRGTRGDAQAFILDSQQADDLDSAITAGNAAAAVYALSADRALGYAPTGDHGMGMRHIANFRTWPVWVTGMTDTANAAADVVGGCICPSTPVNDLTGATTFGMVWKRLPRIETDRIVLGRSLQIVASARAGFGELQDGSGSAIITDA